MIDNSHSLNQQNLNSQMKNNSLIISEIENEIAIYKSKDDKIELDVKITNDNIWLTQKQIAKLFDTKVPAINKHLGKIYQVDELDKKSTISILEIVQLEGKRKVTRNVEFYNLDAIISVGYRVNSTKATQFRIWANSVLKNYLIKGFALNKPRLKEKEITELEEAFNLIKQTLDSKAISGNEAKGILTIITEYANSWFLLAKYDEMIKKIIFCLISYIFFTTSSFANDNCFIAKEKDQIIEQYGNCKLRHSPCSTFKIAISLMGYDQGVLVDENNPKWAFKEGYVDWRDSWKTDQTPTSWIKNSCVWYSQLITTKLGMEKFKNYVTKFNYGNKDVSGDKGENNGLTHSWLSSSLLISPEEQIAFLQKLSNNKLPISLKSQQLTKSIIFVEKLPNGWSLYGKTGGGYMLDKNGVRNKDRQIGWFVGFIQKDNRKIVFANYLEDRLTKENFDAAKKAKEMVREKLLKIN